MKKLILINPVGRKSGYLMSGVSRFAPLGLAYIAAVTPDSWSVKIIDENFEPFRYEAADLVGITAFTSNINRAYKISRTYRENGTRVVLGGIHASMAPEEAKQHADAVVIGEAEGVWPKVVEDAENNALEPVYQGPRLNLSEFSIRPRRDLLNSNYFWHSVQTSRGCPFNCDFCSVSRYQGRTYRQRSAPDVLDELETIPGRYIAFIDDNLIGYSSENRERASSLFQGMIDKKLDKRWWMQTSMNAADDETLVALAAEAGCMFVFIGFETLRPEALKKMKKGINLKLGVENYRKVVRVFHRHGIGVFGAFIIGNDFESEDYYRTLARYLVHSGIDVVQISILTPLPGTELMEEKEAKDKLIYDQYPGDWDRYRFSYMVHKPEGVDIETIYRGDNYIKNRLYSLPTYPYRLLRSFFSLKNSKNALVTFKLNQALRKSWKHSHYYRDFPKTLS